MLEEPPLALQRFQANAPSEVDISVDRSSGEQCLPERARVEASVEAATGETLLPNRRRLKKIRRSASGVVLPLARRG